MMLETLGDLIGLAIPCLTMACSDLYVFGQFSQEGGWSEISAVRQLKSRGLIAALNS